MLSARGDDDILQLYEKTGVAKATSIAEYIVSFLKERPTSKTLIFAHHSYVLDVIDQALVVSVSAGFVCLSTCLKLYCLVRFLLYYI